MSLDGIKRCLGGVWAKESDLSETYEFEFTGETSWGCVRKNAGGARKFKLSYNRGTDRLWWGESYFLDPADLQDKPNKALWYRASDTAQKRAAFVWRKTQDGPPRAVAIPVKAAGGKPSTTSAGKGGAAKAAGKGTPPAKPAGQAGAGTAALAAAPSKGAAAPKAVLQRAPAPKKVTQELKAAADAAVQQLAPPAPGPRKAASTSSVIKPEVILDLEQILVIYKPPHWKCELPGKDEGFEDADKRHQKEPNYLLSWIRDKVTSIEPKLFAEDFNPAQSGTGFGPLSHRIDQETSGPLLVAKTQRAQQFLKAQFHRTEVSKRYVCLVRGKMARASGVVDASIRTLRTDSTTRSEICSGGEWAQTNYQVVATYGSGRQGGHGNGAFGYSLVACDIKSGRTHQIRVHMLHLGHPLVADDKYQPEVALLEDRPWCPRLFLHCYRLCFRGLSGTSELVQCPLPDDLKSALRKLGAADGDGINNDSLFGETSWQREIFRPPLSQWRPATRVQRRVVALLSGASGPVSLGQLNRDERLQELMADEGVPSISRSWLSRHWDVFEAVPQAGGNELCVRLRPAHLAGDGDPEHDLEREIEAVRTELEELERLKQRAVAEEDYSHAAEIKRRADAVAAELASLAELLREEEEPAWDGGGAAGEGGLGPEPGGPLLEQAGEKKKKRKEQPAVETFKQDVRDEALFPALVSMFPKPAARSRSMSAAPSLRAPSVGREAAAPAAAAAAGSEAQADVEETVVDLKDALIEFLKPKDGTCAHLNEVNNDKFLRQVMAAQRPRVQAVNKAWLKEHEKDFALLRTPEGEIYVGLAKTVAAKAAANARAGNTGAARNPAYHRVVQKTSGDSVSPLVYSYSAAEARAPKDGKDDAGEAPQQTNIWRDKFLGALKQVPQQYCSAEELLKAVPTFGDAMGARGVREQSELLVLFLEACPDTFRVERRQEGAHKKYIIWAK